MYWKLGSCRLTSVIHCPDVKATVGSRLNIKSVNKSTETVSIFYLMSRGSISFFMVSVPNNSITTAQTTSKPSFNHNFTRLTSSAPISHTQWTKYNLTISCHHHLLYEPNCSAHIPKRPFIEDPGNAFLLTCTLEAPPRL